MMRALFTGKDNVTYDVGRVLWAMMSVAFVGLSGWHVGHGGAFDPTTWGVGAGTLLAAGSGGLALKSHTEPGA